MIKNLEKKKSIKTLFLGSLFFLLISCQSEKQQNAEVAELAVKEFNDTIFYPDIVPDTIYRGGDGFYQDVKKFNDTLFLFAIPKIKLKSDTLDVYVYYLNSNKYVFYKKFEIKEKNSIRQTLINRGNIIAIQKEMIAYSGDSAIIFYDFLKQKQCYKLPLDSGRLFLTIMNPMQWDEKEKALYTEYIDNKKELKDNISTTEIVAKIDTTKKIVVPLPFIIPNDKRVFNINYKHFFCVADNKVVLKHSFLDEFEIYDLKTKTKEKKTVKFDFVNHVDTAVNQKDYDDVRNNFMNSIIHLGFAYDKFSERFVYLVADKVKERNEKGLKNSPFTRTKIAYILDKNLNILGKVKIDEKFYISSYHFVDSKLILIEACKTKLKVKTIFL